MFKAGFFNTSGKVSNDTLTLSWDVVALLVTNSSSSCEPCPAECCSDDEKCDVSHDENSNPSYVCTKRGPLNETTVIVLSILGGLCAVILLYCLLRQNRCKPCSEGDDPETNDPDAFDQLAMTLQV